MTFIVASLLLSTAVLAFTAGVLLLRKGAWFAGLVTLIPTAAVFVAASALFYSAHDQTATLSKSNRELQDRLNKAERNARLHRASARQARLSLDASSRRHSNDLNEIALAVLMIETNRLQTAQSDSTNHILPGTTEQILARLQTISRNIPSAQQSNLHQKLGQLTEALDPQPYQVFLLAGNELVHGCRGTYYSIRIAGIKNRQPLRFDTRKYTFELTHFQIAITTLHDHLLRPLAPRPFNLYSRGGADQRSYSGPLDENYLFTQVTARRPSQEGQYTKQLEHRHYEKTFNNSDLPFLRAEFVRRAVESTISSIKLENLADRISSQRSPAARLVELVLCVRFE